MWVYLPTLYPKGEFIKELNEESNLIQSLFFVTLSPKGEFLKELTDESYWLSALSTLSYLSKENCSKELIEGSHLFECSLLVLSYPQKKSSLKNTLS